MHLVVGGERRKLPGGLSRLCWGAGHLSSGHIDAKLGHQGCALHPHGTSCQK